MFTGVVAQQAGSTTVHIRYASATPRTAQVRVNGGSPLTVHFPVTATSNDIGTHTITVPLIAGSKTITLDAAGG